MFDVGQGTQDLGFRNELNVLFSASRQCMSRSRFSTTTASRPRASSSFAMRRRVYPSRARRHGPRPVLSRSDLSPQWRIVLLPAGKYTVTYSRGPEYRILTREINVPSSNAPRKLSHEAWIKLADHGWYSGDHHVHAPLGAYESPKEGVQPEDMMRHILGEDLNIGCVLSWGPCWYFQKQYFEGKVSALSTPDNLMRSDVEVSGFPSSHCGHLCLLRLKEDDYPGTTKIEEWPSWDLPVLKWGKEQGGVVGFSHSGWGLQVPATTLPTYDVPPFDGIGANEYIVDVVHDVCDFISAVDTPFVWEMNIWYHTLNCGYTCRISGETDFPCIYGERVGLGRSVREIEGERRSAAELRRMGLRHPRRAQLLQRRARPFVRLQGRRSGRRRDGPAAAPACCRSSKATSCRSASAPRRCSTKSRAKTSAAASSTKNRTGMSSGPGSAIPAACRSS